MRSYIQIIAVLFSLVSLASAQAEITNFNVVQDPGANNHCILEYTFTNNTNEDVHLIQLETNRWNSTTQLQDNNQFALFESAGKKLKEGGKIVYSWRSKNSTVPLAPGQSVTVRLHITRRSRQDFLNGAAVNPGNYLLHEQTTATTRDPNQVVPPSANNPGTIVTQESPIGQTPMETPGGQPIYGPPSSPNISVEDPFLGGFAVIELEAPELGNLPYILLPSFDSLPGMDVGGFHIPANLDALLQFSLTPNPFMLDFQGVVDPVMEGAFGVMMLPSDPAFEGFSFSLAAVVLNSTGTGIADVTPDAVQLQIQASPF